VLAGTIPDYLFKAGAGSAIGRGEPLLRFFAVFYTVNQILTFIRQTFLANDPSAPRNWTHHIGPSARSQEAAHWSRRWRRFPPVFALFRLLESSLRGSFVRAGYELLYIPVRAAEKRAAKTLIDVACDRVGDSLGSGFVQLMLWFGAAFIPSGLLGAMPGLSVAGAWARRRETALHIPGW
jgi:hypothetical protein